MIDEVTVDGTAGGKVTLVIRTVDSSGNTVANDEPIQITVSCNSPNTCEINDIPTSDDVIRIPKAGAVDVEVYSELAHTLSVTVTASPANEALIAGLVPRDVTFVAGL